MIINESQKKTILDAIEDLFGTAQAKLLGRYFAGNRIYFSAAQSAPFESTIEGLYRYALKAHNPDAEVDEESLRTLMQITNNYIEAHKLKVINSTLNDALGAKKAEDLLEVVKVNLDKAAKYMDMLIATETQMVRAYANKEGIQQVAASINDGDPFVFWSGVVDPKLCAVCRAMYHSIDDVWVPKVFRLSELQSGYFNKKEWDGHSPYTNGHPRCRHSMTYLPKNFGFDEKGRISFKFIGYDPIIDQRGLEKSEIIPKYNFGDLDQFIIDGFEHDHHEHDDNCRH